jgi:nifR3 family TIM-barrel protein
MQIGSIRFKDYPVFLAPLEDITDLPFRRICKRYGADMMYTEFISSEGLIRDAKKSLLKLDFHDEERPIGIQVFGHDINSMVRAAEIAEQADPDLIDINWGCPVRKVTNKGGGAGMLRDVDKMVDITRAVVNATRLPVTVKTRLGWDEQNKNIVDIAERLQDTGIRAITIHGRTRAQLYRGQADWTLIGEVKHNPRMNIPVIGNGDVDSAVKAKEMVDRYGVDGLMIGRAAIGNPWIFREVKHYLGRGELLQPPDIAERVQTAREHLIASIDYKGERRGIFEMRKFMSNYFRGLPHFKTMKVKIMTEEDPEELNRLLDQILKLYR